MIYSAPPTIAGFMNSSAFCRIVMGPVGSGKSTGCLMELMKRAQQQTPGPDGVPQNPLRHRPGDAAADPSSRCCTGNSTPWAAPVTDFRVSESTIYMNWRDVACEVHLIPLDDERDQQRLLSAQLTGIWCNEFVEIDPARCSPRWQAASGATPKRRRGRVVVRHIVADGNFPHRRRRVARTAGDEPAAGLEDVWKQPGGLERRGGEPGASAADAGDGEARRITDAEADRAGADILRAAGAAATLTRRGSSATSTRSTATTPRATPRCTARPSSCTWHVADALEPSPGHPLIIGQDFGRNPWSLICQLDSKGRLLMLEEVAASDVGLELHLRTGLRPALAQARYQGLSALVVGDPAGMQRSSSYEETSFDLLRRAGFNAIPAPTNAIDARLRAIESFLIGSSNAGPALLIDKQRCPTLVRGFSGGYRFAHTRHGQAKPTPDKDNGDYSHVHDAGQYVACSLQNGVTPMMASRLGGMRRWATPRERQVSSAGWT